MAIMKWSPVRDLVNLQDEMNRLFNDFFQRKPERKELAEREWSPDVDLSETDNAYIVNAEVPGMDKKDIKITFHNNVLTIKGEKKQEKETKEHNYHQIERVYGSFQRSFTLPSEVVVDKIEASCKNGILKIEIPKSPDAKSKEVAISVS